MKEASQLGLIAKDTQAEQLLSKYLSALSKSENRRKYTGNPALKTY